MFLCFYYLQKDTSALTVQIVVLTQSLTFCLLDESSASFSIIRENHFERITINLARIQ